MTKITPTEEPPASEIKKRTLGEHLSNLLFLLMVAIIPPLHATAFTRADDLRTPIFIAIVTLLTLLGLTNKRPSRIILFSAMIATIYFFARSLLGHQAEGLWSLYSIAPLLGGLLLITSRGNRSHPISYASFATATTIGILLCGLFAIFHFNGYHPYRIIWSGVDTFGAFDTREFALAYFGIATLITTTGAIRVHTPLRYFLAIGAAVSAYLFGAYPSEYPLIALACCATIPPLIVYVSKRKSTKEKELESKNIFLLQSLAGFAVTFTALAGFLTIPDFYQQPYGDSSTELSRLGDLHWTNAIPSISSQNDPLVHNKILNTLFASGRWETVTNPNELSNLRKLALLSTEDNFFLGSGAGSWWANQTSLYKDKPNLAPPYYYRYPAYKSSHNGFLQLLVEYGFIGLILVLAVGIIPILLTIVTSRSREKDGKSNYSRCIEECGLTSATLIGTYCIFFTPGLQLTAPIMLLSASLCMLAERLPDPQKELSKAESLPLPAVTPAVKLPPFGLLRFDGVIPLSIGITFLILSITHIQAAYQRSQGDALMLYQQYDEAQKHYLNAIDIAEGNADIYYNVALSYRYTREKKDLKQSEKYTDLALTRRPYDSRYLIMKAELQTQSGLLRAGAANAQQAIDYDPFFVQAYLLLSTEHQRFMRIEESANILKQLLRRGTPPTHISLLLNKTIGEIYLEILLKPDIALPYLEKALEVSDTPQTSNLITDMISRSNLLQQKTQLLKEGKEIPKELTEAIEGHHHDHNPLEGLVPSLPHHSHNHDH